MLVAVAVPEEAFVASDEREWLGVWPACMVRRSASFAAKTCMVWCFDPRGDLGRAAFVGGEPDLLDAWEVAFDGGVWVNVGF